MPVNTEALARGLGQGVTFGFMDELAAAMQAYRNAGKPAPEVQGFDIKYNPWSQMQADYEKTRDDWRKKDKELAQEAPGEYMLGNVAGGLPTGMAATSIPQNLALGAAYGLGGSEGSKEQQAEAATKEALISGGLTAANPWLGMAGTIIKFPGAKKVIQSAESSPSKSSNIFQISEKLEQVPFVKFYDAVDNADEIRNSVKLTGKKSEPYVGRDISNPKFLSKNKPIGPANQAPVEDFVPNGVLGSDLAQGGADPFAWMDTKYGFGKKALEAHRGKNLEINTRSDLIAHDDYIGLLDPSLHHVTFRVPNANDQISRVSVGGAPSFKRIMTAIKKLKENEIPVSIIFEDLPLKESLKRTNDFELIKELQKNGIPYRKEMITLDSKQRKILEGQIGKDSFRPKSKSEKLFDEGED